MYVYNKKKEIREWITHCIIKYWADCHLYRAHSHVLFNKSLNAHKK